VPYSQLLVIQMTDQINTLLENIVFIFERISWISIIDMLLVMGVFLGILLIIRGSQSIAILRGAIVLFALVGLIASINQLPAFSWLVRVAMPAILVAIPVIFAPEIRQALERLGRAGTFRSADTSENMGQAIRPIVLACSRLSRLQHGALIVLKRQDSLDEIIRTGVFLDAHASTELLLQIFYPNTPLHDGAAIITEGRISAASCVLPLSSSGVLNEVPDRQMGLRHRAALGMSEISDAVSIIISEETGQITIAHTGRMIRRLDSERLENILNVFFRESEQKNLFGSVMDWFKGRSTGKAGD
jgi:diadenylate cyclase